jgi:hypothetical protein
MARREQEAHQKRGAAAREAAELRAAADKAAKDSQVLHKHLDLLRASRRDAGRQMEADRQRYQQHLAQLRAQLAAYEQHLAHGAAAVEA